MTDREKLDEVLRRIRTVVDTVAFRFDGDREDDLSDLYQLRDATQLMLHDESLDLDSAMERT